MTPSNRRLEFDAYYVGSLVLHIALVLVSSYITTT